MGVRIVERDNGRVTGDRHHLALHLLTGREPRGALGGPDRRAAGTVLELLERAGEIGRRWGFFFGFGGRRDDTLWSSSS